MASFSQNPELNQLIGQERLNRFMTPGMKQPISGLSALSQQNQFRAEPLPAARPPQIFSQPVNQNQGWWDSIKEYLFGVGPQQFSYSPYSEQGRSMLDYLLQNAQQNLQNPYQGFEELQKQIMDTYNQQILPETLERFGALGGAAPSSFAKEINMSNQGLAQQLLAHKLGYGQQRQQQALQQAQLGLRPQYEMGYAPGQQGLIPSIAQRAIPAGLNLLGMSRFGGL